MTPLAASRRRVLAGLAASSAFASLPIVARGHDLPADPMFGHGIASGDPDTTSVVLWTRLTAPEVQQGAPEAQWQASWEMAEDRDFAQVVTQGTITTDASRDHTVKLLASGLAPGSTYYYRFRTGEHVSPVGRTRTLPEGQLDRLGIALVSCSNYAFGFFNAYDAIAHNPAVDYVLHTGDYIYEYGADGWGSGTAQKLDRVHAPAQEIVSLSDYRMRHAQYKSDGGSQAMHAAHPFLGCWDDHESTNNPWAGGAQNHQPETEGDWAERRAASIQAYYEWMPVREPEWLEEKDRTRMQFWRAYRFGDLATLHTLETRHTARAQQIDYAAYTDTLTEPAEARRFMAETMDAPDRPMLSAALERDLSAALSSSVAEGQPWRLIGNPMPIARTHVPDVVALGIIGDPRNDATQPEAAQALAWKGRLNLPFYPDTWDGYGWARERLYDLSRTAGAGDLLFLTGDSHSFWANQLADGAGRSAGIELGTAGVTSPGDFVESGFDLATAAALDRAFEDHNEEVVWTDNLHQGYVLLELTRTQGVASFVAVDTVLSRQYGASILHRMRIVRAGAGIAFA